MAVRASMCKQEEGEGVITIVSHVAKEAAVGRRSKGQRRGGSESRVRVEHVHGMGYDGGETKEGKGAGGKEGGRESACVCGEGNKPNRKVKNSPGREREEKEGERGGV